MKEFQILYANLTISKTFWIYYILKWYRRYIGRIILSG